MSKKDPVKKFNKLVADTVKVLQEHGVKPKRCSHVGTELTENDKPVKGWEVEHNYDRDKHVERDDESGWEHSTEGGDHRLILTTDGQLIWCHYRRSEGSIGHGKWRDAVLDKSWEEYTNRHDQADIVGTTGEPFEEMSGKLIRFRIKQTT